MSCCNPYLAESQAKNTRDTARKMLKICASMSNVMHFAETTVVRQGTGRPVRQFWANIVEIWILSSGHSSAAELRPWKTTPTWSPRKNITFIHFHTQFRCRGAAGQRWKNVHQIRGCQTQRGHLRWQLCADWAHMHLLHTAAGGTVWRGLDNFSHQKC